MSDTFRYEKKYCCNAQQIEILKNRVDTILSIDKHCKNGFYNIRSIYFDTYDKEYYNDNEIGVDPREKYRIRIYNGNSDRIQLEIKRKEHTMTQKQSCLLTLSQFEDIMSGHRLNITPENPKVLNRFISLSSVKPVKPSVIVDYDRIPYVYTAGNVRITFDYNIKSSTNFNEFFNEKISGRPIMPTGMDLMEVKYTNFIPSYIFQILQTQDLRQTTFSKYALCKRFELIGGINYGNSK